MELRKLYNLVEEYFKGFFDEMYLRERCDSVLGVEMRARIRDIGFEYLFSCIEFENHFKMGTEYHILENVKGEFVRALEKAKAAD